MAVNSEQRNDPLLRQHSTKLVDKCRPTGDIHTVVKNGVTQQGYMGHFAFS
jgi:hypothetical protein